MVSQALLLPLSHLEEVVLCLVWHSWAIKVDHHQEIVSLTQGEHRSGFRHCTCERAGGWSLCSSGSTTVVMPIKLVTMVTTSWLIVQGVPLSGQSHPHRNCRNVMDPAPVLDNLDDSMFPNLEQQLVMHYVLQESAWVEGYPHPLLAYWVQRIGD